MLKVRCDLEIRVRVHWLIHFESRIAAIPRTFVANAIYCIAKVIDILRGAEPHYSKYKHHEGKCQDVVKVEFSRCALEYEEAQRKDQTFPGLEIRSSESWHMSCVIT